MEKSSLVVRGMSCQHCVSTIERNVGALSGVSEVSVYLQESKVEVTFDPTKIKLDHIKQAISENGYEVV
ncbi:copper ion binding protein [Fredinandcohnia humi]